MKILSVIGALLIVLASMGYINTGPALKVELSSEGFVSAERGKYYAEYNLGQQFYAPSYRVVNFDKANSSSQNLGISYFLSVLSENDYQEFLKVKQVSCPASYLNDHAKNYLLVVGSNQLENIKSLSLSNGDRVNLQVRALETAYLEVGGHEVQGFTMQGAEAVWVEELVEI